MKYFQLQNELLKLIYYKETYIEHFKKKIISDLKKQNSVFCFIQQVKYSTKIYSENIDTKIACHGFDDHSVSTEINCITKCNFQSNSYINPCFLFPRLETFRLFPISFHFLFLLLLSFVSGRY